MISISGCIISFNEEDRIAECIESLSFCDEILVLDSNSTDRTREIAASLGARVEIQPFLGHRDQKQAAAERASHEWIFSLDADERASAELVTEIQAMRERGPGSVVGYSMPRKNRYLGRWMKHGLFWPDRKLRCFDRRHCRWGGTDPHDRVEPEPGAEIVRLDGVIFHDSYRSFDEHRRTVDGFAAIAAKAMWQEGRKASLWSPWSRAAGAWLKAMGPKLAWLDGWRGVLAAWMSGRYNFVRYRELRRLQREGRS
mgnify:CR=1 FL=1